MTKLTLKDNQVNEVLNKLVPSWEQCVDQDTLAKAQTPKSSTRNWLFGTIINAKFIKLTKPSCGFSKGTVVSIADIYNNDSASTLAGLIIYRLGHSGLQKQPTVVEA